VGPGREKKVKGVMEFAGLSGHSFLHGGGKKRFPKIKKRQKIQWDRGGGGRDTGRDRQTDNRFKGGVVFDLIASIFAEGQKKKWKKETSRGKSEKHWIPVIIRGEKKTQGGGTEAL